MNKTYTITRINNNEVDRHQYDYVTLCPVCHTHFVIQSGLDSDWTDVAFLSQPMCTTCSYRFLGLYSAKIGEYSFFDGFLDIATAELIDACNFPPKDFTYIPLSHFAHNIAEAFEDPTAYIHVDDLPF